jgi:long-chain acyl-CoA synthetase
LEAFAFSPEERTLSFLPWAHCFGQTCELHCLLGVGASMALNSSMERILTELEEVKPSVLISVPRIFNKIYDSVHRLMAERPVPIQKLFALGLKLSSKKQRGESLNFLEQGILLLADRLIFQKVRNRFGGRLSFTVSGGAALSREVGEFVDSLGIVVYEGYGLTEASPVISANCPGARRLGSVGKPFAGVRVLIDTAVTGDAKQGEIVVYGPNVMQGYHRRAQETQQVLTSDGGLRTGDLGYLDEDGYLWITGRIKEQYKLENGKYVVPTPIEETLKLSPFISNVMVYGANKPYNVALVVPDQDTVLAFATKEGISGSYEDLLEKEVIKKKIFSEVEKMNERFRSFDRIKRIALVAEDFTVHNDMLTPSLKVKRRNVLKRWESKLHQLYGD